MMTAAAMLSRKGRLRGVRDNDDSEEEVVEVDDSDTTSAASGGGGRQKGGLEESLRRTARPTAPTGRMGAVTTKSTKTCRPPPRHRIVGDSGVDCRDDIGGRGGRSNGSSENEDRGQDSDHDDICPSFSYSYHPSFSLADPPAPSLPDIAGGGGDTRHAAFGGNGDDQDDVAVLPRWRLDAGNANAQGADAVAGGVVIDKLNPFLVYYLHYESYLH